MNIVQITPTALTAYLQSTSWEQIESIRGGKVLVCLSPWNTEFLVPMSEALSDYSQRVMDLAVHVAENSSRAVQEVIEEVRKASWDELTFSLDAPSGNVTIGHAPDFYAGIKEMCRASAAQANRAAATYASVRGTLPDKISEEWCVTPASFGSYKAQVLCPLSHRTESLHQLNLFEPEELTRLRTEQVNREVVTVLVRSLNLAHEAAGKESEELLLCSLDEDENPILSKNFCTGLVKAGIDELSLSFGVNWSRLIEAPEGRYLSTNLKFSPAQLEFVRECLPQFAENTIEEGDYVAMVSDLSGIVGAGGKVSGKVVFAIEEPLVGKYRATLDPEDYKVANQAHILGARVRFKATLERFGRIRDALHVRGLEIDMIPNDD